MKSWQYLSIGLLVLIVVGLVARLWPDLRRDKADLRAERDTLRVANARANAELTIVRTDLGVKTGEILSGKQAVAAARSNRRSWRAEASFRVATMPARAVRSEVDARLDSTAIPTFQPVVDGASNDDDWLDNARTRRVLVRLSECDSIEAHSHALAARNGVLEQRSARQRGIIEAQHRHAAQLRAIATERCFLGIGRNRRVVQKARLLPDTTLSN